MVLLTFYSQKLPFCKIIDVYFASKLKLLNMAYDLQNMSIPNPDCRQHCHKRGPTSIESIGTSVGFHQEDKEMGQ